MAAPAIAPVSLPRRTRLHLIVNPRASRADARVAEAVAGELGRAFAVQRASTDARGHATALAREAAERGAELVVAMGGDGTFSEVADGLAGTETALACVPAGVTNVFARAVGHGRDPLLAARRLAAGEPRYRRLDVGVVNGRHFLSSSGIGFSASMSATADATPAGKERFGQLHFAAAAGTEIARRYLVDPPRMRLQSGAWAQEGITAIVQNGRALTYFGSREIRAAEDVDLESGTIAATVLRRARPWDVPAVVGRLLAGRVAGHPWIDGADGLRAVTATSLDGRPLPVEADGEYLGDFARVEYGVRPGALLVAV